MVSSDSHSSPPHPSHRPHLPRVGCLVRVRVLLPTTLLVVAACLLAVPRADAAGDARVAADGVWPLRPRPEVVARFDPPSTRWGAGHRGVDLAGRIGQVVRAAEAGRVGFAGMLAGRGVVVVDHGDTRTTYEPVDADVHVGDLVAAGDALGRLELFGSHCFPRACLHWGLIEGADHYLDPLSLVGGGPVRLLPLGPQVLAAQALPLRTGAFPALTDAPVLVEPGSGPRVRLAVGLP